MTISLRQLRPGDDLTSAAKLFDAYRQFYGLPADVSAARTYLVMRLQSAQSTVYVAEQGGRAVGFMQMYQTFCSLALAPIWVLYDLYVTPDARKLGVAGALLDEAARFGREAGAAYLQLSTAHGNTVAQQVYEARGWKQDMEFRTYTLALDAPN
jgi:ribosomal protein S18 acetylase RimI-like enzyme